MIVRVTLISVGCIIALTQTSLIAQQHRSPISQSQQADAQLNRTYQQLMKTLSPAAKEQLRKAERAWLDFAVRNKAAFQAAAPRLGLSASQCDDFEVGELFSRGNELSAISQPNQSANEEAAAHLPRTDEELNTVYKRCLALSPTRMRRNCATRREHGLFSATPIAGSGRISFSSSRVAGSSN